MSSRRGPLPRLTQYEIKVNVHVRLRDGRSLVNRGRYRMTKNQ